jgi:L-iditol 2-dehydrogenase
VRSLRLHGPHDLQLVDETRPDPGPGEEAVRVASVGICGSDLHWYSESSVGDARLSRPLVLGHEAGGVIDGGPRAGLLVALDPAIPCGSCDQCQAGRGHLCRAIRFAGHGTNDGFLREVVAWPSKGLVPLPDRFEPTDAAMLEPLGVALHAIRLGGIRPGARVGVFGCGPIGLFIVQLSRASGATLVAATDVLDHRVEAARDAGATHVALVAGGAERAELLAATHDAGLDVTFEAAGVDDALETALTLAAPAGTVVEVGIPVVDRALFTASTARRKGLTLKFSRRMNRVYPETIGLVQSGLIDVRSIVTASFDLAEYDAAFSAAAAREGLKTVVRPSR